MQWRYEKKIIIKVIAVLYYRVKFLSGKSDEIFFKWRKLSPTKIIPDENYPRRKLSPTKIIPDENYPDENYPRRKFSPTKIFPDEVFPDKVHIPDPWNALICLMSF